MANRERHSGQASDFAPPDGGPEGLRRLRGLSWVLDRAFSAGGKRRFGLDPLIGLIPGLGDWLGSLISLYVVYEAARLGIRPAVLLRMVGNIVVESVVGTVPVAGDVFDFVWQANTRNLRLVEQHHSPALQPRPIGRLAIFLLVAAAILVVGLAVVAFLIARWLWSLFA